jgi:hypothetical protein
MKRIIRLTESDLTRIVRRVINEQNDPAQVAREFVNSGKGIGTDETGMVTAIKKLSNSQQFYLFAQSVRKLTGDSVGDFFNNEMSKVDRNLYNQIVDHVLKITNGAVDVSSKGINNVNHAIDVIGKSLSGKREDY